MAPTAFHMASDSLVNSYYTKYCKTSYIGGNYI